MKKLIDTARILIQKAENDLANARLCLKENIALDTVCFHSQQAAEKYLKAYLASRAIDFPFIHDITRLLDICMKQEASFSALVDAAGELSPYAVEIRYDDIIIPSRPTAEKVLSAAEMICAFILEHLPGDLRTP